MTIYKKVWSLFDSRQRAVSAFLFCAMLINSIMEAFSIGLIIPLVKFMGNVNELQRYPRLIKTAASLGVTDNTYILIYLFAAFVVIYVSKTLYNIALTYFQLRFIGNALNSFSSRLLNTYLSSPWTFHLKRNSAELQNNVINQAGMLCTGLLAALFNLSTELLVTSAIIILLILIDPTATIFATLLFGMTSLLIFYIIREKLGSFGSAAHKYSTILIKLVNEAFGSIKETKILGREEYFIKHFMKNNRLYNKTWIYPKLIELMQRSTIETLFIVCVIVIAIFTLVTGKETISLLATLTLFAAAAFRLVPSVNRINSSIGSIKIYSPVLDIIYHDLTRTRPTVIKTHRFDYDQPPSARLTFQKGIELKNISFRYPDTNLNTLSSVSISIPKGHSIAFIGPSGAGKTTIVDIILGLLKPDSGKILVDGCNIHENLDLWQQHIGYIPQNIYLSDNTIRRNIAFGLDDTEIDDNKVWAAIKNAQLEEVVMALPEGLDTRIGEHGLRMSGGQRQRIGIARALYNDPEVLVMDEATSSLDTETEKELSNAIDRLSGQKTLLIIAHRMTTVEKCDMRFYIRNGKIEKTLMREKKEAG